jgi:lipoprotein-anchoring transpeptidase ErfK/SrfK
MSNHDSSQLTVRGAAQQTQHALNLQSTMPARPVGQTRQRTQVVQATIPHPVVRAPLPLRAAPKRKSSGAKFLLYALTAAMIGVFLLACGGLSIGALLLYSGGILPGVSAGGVALGGLSEAEASTKLQTQWANITLIDEATGNLWRVDPAQLGITLNAAETAERAHRQGRGDGNILAALRGIDVDPVLSIDPARTQSGLEALIGEIETPAVNAGVRLVNGVVEATPAQNGRMLDIPATLAQVTQNAAELLADGELELVMQDTLPTITDSTAMVQAASQLLTSPLSVRVYDPVTGDIVNWEAPPEQWAAWLTASSDSPTGLALSVQDAPVRAFLTDNAARFFDSARYLDYDKAVSAIQSAVSQNQTTTTVRVYHHDRQHVVQSGETIISIAWDYGVPYPWVQQANNGMTALSAGQTITIPSPDNFFQYEPVPNKRIEVSISEQRVRVYENGGLKWEWVASTGINTSPTWTGVYQIISHVDNAYAANWDLWMPNFMGVYQPIPGADFTNGFHGFPTRGGGQLLWENSLGTRVTYGCILLSNTNVQQLYTWAETGVVVEILP